MDSTRTQDGLLGVVAADTELSDVNGARGELLIRGHWLEQLVESADFEAVCHLLWVGRLPSPEERSALSRRLGVGRVHAFELVPRLGGALEMAEAMDALRAATAQLPSSGDDRADAIRLTASLPVFAAAWQQARRGVPVSPPDPERDHAADVLRLLRGAAISDAEAQALDTYLCTVAEHGMNASTFAARVVTSTGSDAVSATVAAIGALKGPLHGGAPGPVLRMLQQIGTPDRAHAYLESELAAGRRIMGMGHRIYRVRDPRAMVLERASERLSAGDSAVSGRIALARAVEQRAVQLLSVKYPGRPLRANVEFFTAVLLDALGLPPELFSAVFAISRVAGWCAHVSEQRRTGRLVRPESRYVGSRPEPARAAPTS